MFLLNPDESKEKQKLEFGVSTQASRQYRKTEHAFILMLDFIFACETVFFILFPSFIFLDIPGMKRNCCELFFPFLERRSTGIDGAILQIAIFGRSKTLSTCIGMDALQLFLLFHHRLPAHGNRKCSRSTFDGS